MELLYVIVGIICGALIAYFFVSARQSKLAQEQINAHPVTLNLKESLMKASKDLEAERKQKEAEIGEKARAQEQVRALEAKLKEQENEMIRIRQEMTREFENLANRIFDEKSTKITEQNKNQLEGVLHPFRDKLKDFELKVERVYTEENKERINLKAEITQLAGLNKQLSADANNLATALKGDNKSQGNWGELILEKILERSGLQKDVEYVTQESTTNVHGDTIRPDVVVYLPEDKHIIIDSKVSLTAYTAMIGSTTDDDKQRQTKLHCDSVRSHVKQLSDKDYQTARGLHSPDFVILFMPIEAAFAAAMQSDPDLYAYAWDRKIVIASPTTLLATLRTVSSIWMQERRTRNVVEIAEEGGKLYDKFVAFVDDMLALGTKMDQAKKEYEGAMNKLTTGTGNLVSRTEKMKALGAKATKSMNPKVIARGGDLEE